MTERLGDKEFREIEAQVHADIIYLQLAENDPTAWTHYYSRLKNAEDYLAKYGESELIDDIYIAFNDSKPIFPSEIYPSSKEHEMNVEREARRDAREYARAQMYYGEGAGIRRRLIENTVQSKIDRNPKYHQAFRVELDKQDMAEHATKARRERRRKDTSAVVTKNTKALATGDYQNLQSGVLVVVIAGYFVHKTGLDKKAYEKAKELKTRASNKIRKMRGKGPVTVVHNIHYPS